MTAENPLAALAGMAAQAVRCEDALRESVRHPDEFMSDITSHLIVAGGKRIRPLLAVATAATGMSHSVEVSQAVVLGGVACELVQVGSLYHDDVMDDAVVRRSVESVNARWGNLRAILAGDYLLAKASEIAASLGTEVAGLLAATIGRLCEGQLAELQKTYVIDRTETEYELSLLGKTASLFATSCRIGAIVGGLERDQIDAATEYGEALGMVFQLVDDLLDVWATDEQLGKPAGHDMAEGVYTLPVIRCLAGPNGDALRAILGGPLDEARRIAARDLVRADPAAMSSLDRVRYWADKAQASLEALPESPGRVAMAELPAYLLGTVPFAG